MILGIFFKQTNVLTEKPQYDRIELFSLYNLSWKNINKLLGYKFKHKTMLNLEYFYFIFKVSNIIFSILFHLTP